MNNPLVSVGIPFFNCKDFLLDAIRSIFAQTYTNWELILVDDGSTDGSLEIALSIDDPRTRVLPPDGKNKQLPTRLNQIIQAARGEFLVRMDADDLSHPERLAKQLEFLNNHKEVDVVGANMCILDEQNNPACKSDTQGKHDKIVNKYRGFSFAHATVMTRTEWSRKWQYDEKAIRAEDVELWSRSYKDSVFANIQDILYFYRGVFSISLSNYARANRTVARYNWRYLAPEIGRLKAAYYVYRCYLKTGIFASAKLLNLHQILIRRRYSRLTPQECAELIAVLDVIRKTEVPIRDIK